MNDIVDKFKQEIRNKVDLVNKASNSIEKEKLNEIKENHDRVLSEIEKILQKELSNVNEEYQKRVLILSSNKDKLDVEEYNEYAGAAESIYNKKVDEIKSSCEDKKNEENKKYNEIKVKYEKELKLSKVNLLRKKIESLKEKEIDLLVKELDELKENYNKEKEKIEIMRKESEKQLKEEYSFNRIQDFNVTYIPEEQREEIAKYVHYGYLPNELIENKELLRGNEVIERMVQEKMQNEEYKIERELREKNEQKYIEISEAIKQIMALKVDQIIFELEQTEVICQKSSNEEVDEEVR